MKKKYKLLMWLLAALPLVITAGCSKSNDTPEIEVPPMAISEKEITVKIGTDAHVDITPGAGEYKVFSLNEEVAKAQIVSNKLTVQGVNNGKTSLIISDNDHCYQRLEVTVYWYDAVKVEQEEVALNFRLGYSKQTTIQILEANGSCTVASSDNTIIKASVADNLITLTAIGKSGSANVTVTDVNGLQAVIKVQATATEIAYDEAELEAIKADETLRYVFIEMPLNFSGMSEYLLNTQENNLNLYGWSYNNRQYHKIYFAGDKGVGKKTEAKLTQNIFGTYFNEIPIELEIIKNDGTKIWAVYSFMQGEVTQSGQSQKLYFGHFCQPINP